MQSQPEVPRGGNPMDALQFMYEYFISAGCLKFLISNFFGGYKYHKHLFVDIYIYFLYFIYFFLALRTNLFILMSQVISVAHINRVTSYVSTVGTDFAPRYDLFVGLFGFPFQF